MTGHFTTTRDGDRLLTPDEVAAHRFHRAEVLALLDGGAP